MLRFFVDWLNVWSRMHTKYTLLRNDEGRRDTSIRLGVQAIVYAGVGLVTVLLCAAGVVALWSHFLSIRLGDGTYDMPLFTFLGLLVLAGAILLTTLQCSVNSILLCIFQYKLNDRPIRHAALVTALIASCGMLGTSIALVAWIL